MTIANTSANLGSDVVGVDRHSLECASILLEYVQEMADPRITSGRLLELVAGLRDEWGLRGGDGVVSDVLNALYLWEAAEVERIERERQELADAADTHPWNHDTHGERDGLR